MSWFTRLLERTGLLATEEESRWYDAEDQALDRAEQARRQRAVTPVPSAEVSGHLERRPGTYVDWSGREQEHGDVHDA